MSGLDAPQPDFEKVLLKSAEDATVTNSAKTSKILALLAAAEGEVVTRIDAHGATWDIYDSLPGEERNHQDTYWKTGTVGNLQWTCFQPRLGREDEATA